MAEKTHLPANTVCSVRVQLTGTEAWKGDALFEAHDREGLEIPHQLIKVREAEERQHNARCTPGVTCNHQKKYAYIKVYNKSKVPLKLKRNKELGAITRVKKLETKYV